MIDWAPCGPEVELPGAECATVGLQLDRFDPSPGTTTIALARYPAREPARGQLWFVTGGPGDSGLEDLPNVEGMRDLVPDLDIVTFDHRGVGQSGRLSCPEQEAADSKDGAEIVGGEWEACAAHVGETYAHVLPYLTVTAAAWDLEQLTDEVAGPDDEVYWWGVSYGTTLVQRALHLAPDRPTGVILDGLVPPDWTFTEFDEGLDTTARRFLERCADEPACASHLDGHPIAVAERVLADPQRRCERLGVDTRLTRLLAGVLLMPGERYATLVPAVHARLDRCAPRDRRAFVHLFGALFPEDGSGIAEKPGHSPVLQRHVAYSELWDPDAPPVEALRAGLGDNLATTEVSATFAEVAPIWPLVPERHPEAWGVFPETDVPVLALHGGLDPTMPIERVDGYEDWLVGPGQRLVRVPLGQHVTLNTGDCVASVYAAFLADPLADLDTACVDALPGFDWDGDPAFNEEVWGTPDRWGDEGGCGCAARNGSPLAAVLPLAGLVRRRPLVTRRPRGRDIRPVQTGR